MSAGIVFVIIAAITAFASLVGGVAHSWLKLKEKQLDHAAVLAADKAAAQATQIEQIEQRMRVLERIATDRGLAVADEIERLRDDTVN